MAAAFGGNVRPNFAFPSAPDAVQLQVVTVQLLVQPVLNTGSTTQGGVCPSELFFSHMSPVWLSVIVPFPLSTKREFVQPLVSNVQLPPHSSLP